MRYEPQYSAQILTGSGWLVEHHTRIFPERRTTECYVCSEANEAFTIWFTNPLGEDLHLQLYMDGVRLGAWSTTYSPCVTLSGIRTSKTEKRQFFFSSGWVPSEDFDLEPLDDDQRKRWKERGSIKLMVFKVKNVYAEVSKSEDPYHQLPKDQLDTVRFESKKDAQTSTRAVQEFQWDEQYGNRPVATFIYRHRPQDWLRKYGFIKQPESDADLDLDLSTMSISENASAALVNELRRLKLADEGRRTSR